MRYIYKNKQSQQRKVTSKKMTNKDFELVGQYGQKEEKEDKKNTEDKKNKVADKKKAVKK